MARHLEDLGDEPPRRRRKPAATPEARENELISLSLDAAEEMIRSGQATSQLLVHFAKLGSSREQLEQERLRNENAKLKKQIEDMNTAVEIKDLLDEALKAFRTYTGDEEDEDDPFDQY